MDEGKYSERILELMRVRGISKSDLADAMGIKKQNVNLLLKTNNVEKLIGVSKVLKVSLNDIIGEYKTEPDVKGCIVYQGVVHPINSRKDIEDILKGIQ